MNRSIAFVGAGPTTIYTLHALLSHPGHPCSITLFEEQAIVGRGTPYRPGWNDPAMLSNIASIEIPPLEQTLVEWLREQPAHRLTRIGVDPKSIDERTFYPRLALGEYFFDQLQAMLKRAVDIDRPVTVRTSCRVLDAISKPEGMVLRVRPKRGEDFEERFDHLVLATGHQWPADPEVRPGYFLSPWPASALARIAPLNVGIRGSSLTAIDAAVALAVAHGEFADGVSDRLSYIPGPNTEPFHMTMISRKGLLPEADFYHPVPYEPLKICTAEAIEKLIAAGSDGLLDAAFDLFKRELAQADRPYANRVRLEAIQLEQFCDRYFADRIASDTFVSAARNLQEAERDYEAEHTVPWRYAILRMHEVMALIVPHLGQEDFDRFTQSFKPVFVDDYATVPHESIKRMVALHEAEKLSVVAVGENYRVDSRTPDAGADLLLAGDRRHFDVFIEATGQRPLTAKDFPFPSLLKQGIVQDEDVGDDKGAARGILIDDQFQPVSDDIPTDRLFCLSLPFLLGRHPFIQGITSSHEMGTVVGEQLALAINDMGRVGNSAVAKDEAVQ